MTPRELSLTWMCGEGTPNQTRTTPKKQREEEQMQEQQFDGDLLVAVEEITTERSRGDQPSDGGTGRSDHNDSIR